MHRPDLPLYDNAAKVGFGLWDYPYVTLALEGVLLLGAMGMYLATSRPRAGRRQFAMPVFGLAMLAMQTGMLFTAPPATDRAMAATALAAYAVLTVAIAWLETGQVAESRQVAA
ncbi:MAG: hypothetical protein AB1635_20480 [Acidobacteriota bacterium]